MRVVVEVLVKGSIKTRLIGARDDADVGVGYHSYDPTSLYDE